MSMPSRLNLYLREHGLHCETAEHAPSRSSAQTARTAHVSQHQLAKAVLLQDDAGCVIALVPAYRSVHMGKLARLLSRPNLHLADDEAIAPLFPDCAPGAVPGVGMAWGLDVVVEEELEDLGTVYLEAGDLCQLIKVSHDQFRELTHDLPHGRFTESVELRLH